MLSQTEDVRGIAGHSSLQNVVKTKKSARMRWLALAVVSVAVAAVLGYGMWSRVRASKKLGAETSQLAVTTVSVVTPKQSTPAQEIILPGNVQPFISSPIYARTNGYLKNWYADIGAHVKQGQLLAVIDAPEVDQQLAQSLSNLNTAKANLALAEITKNRYEGLIKTNAVAQQDVDNAVGSYKANQAIVEADEANASGSILLGSLHDFATTWECYERWDIRTRKGVFYKLFSLVERYAERWSIGSLSNQRTYKHISSDMSIASGKEGIPEILCLQ